MSASKRERELAKLREQRAQARAAEKSARTRRLTVIAAGVVAVLLVGGGLIWAATSGDETPAVDAAASPSAPATPGTGTPAAADCAPLSTATPSNQQFDGYTGSIKNGTYSLDLTTNCGPMTIEFDSKGAPETTKALTFLADRGFYDNTTCHRLTTSGIFVLQCGDPAGNGTGGPGFVVPDENPPSADATGMAVYERGTVAMANAGPGTTGSQFFLVYEDSPLAPSYTVVGKVTEGMDILDAIAAEGTADGSADGAPAQPLQITKATSTLTQKVGDN